LGLFSLTTSQLAPINKFGYYSGLATLGAIIILFTFLPSALVTFKPGYEKKDKSEVENESGVIGAVTRFWDRVGDWVIGNYALVSVLGILVLGFGAYGISKVETQVHLLKLFDKDAKILKDYHWMEDNLGQLVPAEIVVTVDAASQRELYVDEQKLAGERRFRAEIAGAETEEEIKALEERGPEWEIDTRTYERKLSMLERIELSSRVRKFLEMYFGPNGTGDVGSGMSTDVFVPLYTLTSQNGGYKRDVVSNRLYEKRHEMIEPWGRSI